MKNSTAGISAIPANTDTALVIRASANSSAGLTVTGYNSAFVANKCLQFTISVNGYQVQSRLLTTVVGATTCTTYNSSGYPVTVPAQQYDDIDFTNCMGNIGSGAISIEVSDAQYEFRCTNQGIITSCPTGPAYQTHITSGNLWVKTDATQLPTISGSTVTPRACDSL